jgi:hypothetical protein
LKIEILLIPLLAICHIFEISEEVHQPRSQGFEDEGRDEKALVWAGHVTTQKMAVFDSYLSKSGEISFKGRLQSLLRMRGLCLRFFVLIHINYIR